MKSGGGNGHQRQRQADAGIHDLEQVEETKQRRKF